MKLAIIMAEAPKDQFEESCNEFRKLNKTAFFVGYTGGAGKALLAELVETNLYEKLILLGRRKIDLPDDDKYANVVSIVCKNMSVTSYF